MPIKILVVDDEPQVERLILQRFRRKIRNKEYDLEFAQNGLEALEKLNQTPDFDMVLTDINMPQMDGLTFLSKLNELESHLKAVMVSAYGDMENIRTAMNLGAYDFVTKPINFEDLEITIAKTMKEIEILREAAVAREKLNRLQQELAIASEIQKSILPTDFTTITSSTPLELHAEMIAAKAVGGDFYDFFLIDENQLGLVVGDVSGKGMPAALFMAVSRTLLKTIGLNGMPPSECLTQVNLLLNQDNVTSMFVTIFYGVFHMKTGSLEYCIGGHNPPYIVEANGELKYLDDSQNIALGVLESYQYQSRKIVLEPGSSLVLYTDGITEAINKAQDFFSEERLEGHLKKYADASPRDMINVIVDEVEAFSVGMPQFDDITMMVVRRR